MDHGAFKTKADRCAAICGPSWVLVCIGHASRSATPPIAMRRCRHLRDCDMVRLRCDIGDFDPKGVPAIRDSAAGWVAMGKHLCGGATDLMLRCCVRNLVAGDKGAPASISITRIRPHAQHSHPTP